MKFPKWGYILCTSTKPCTPKTVQIWHYICVSIFTKRERREIDEPTNIIKYKHFKKKYNKNLPERICGQFYCSNVQTNLTSKYQSCVGLYKVWSMMLKHYQSETKKGRYLPWWAIQCMPYYTNLTFTFNLNGHRTKNSAFPNYIPIIYCHINLLPSREQNQLHIPSLLKEPVKPIERSMLTKKNRPNNVIFLTSHHTF